MDENDTIDNLETDPADNTEQKNLPSHFTVTPEGVAELITMVTEMISSTYVKQTIFTGINNIFTPVFKAPTNLKKDKKPN